METIRKTRATALVRVIRFLREIGAPTEAALRRAKLPLLISERPGAWVASRCHGQFLELVARRWGIQELGFRVGLDAGSAAWSAPITQRLMHSPTLYHGLATISAHCHQQASHMKVWLQPHGDAVRLYHRGNIDTGAPGHHQDTWFSIQALVAIIRQFAGAHWCPIEISATSPIVCDPVVSAVYPATPILRGQPIDAITIPHHLLHTRRHVSSRPHPMQTMAGGTPEVESDFAGSLRGILAPYLLDGYPDVELAADIAGTSVRALQRRLSACGTTYSEMLERVRFDAAAQAMEDRGRKLTDIALDLGYADQSSFTRAFRRWTGMSPRQYRRARHAPAAAASAHAA